MRTPVLLSPGWQKVIIRGVEVVVGNDHGRTFQYQYGEFYHSYNFNRVAKPDPIPEQMIPPKTEEEIRKLTDALPANVAARARNIAALRAELDRPMLPFPHPAWVLDQLAQERRAVDPEYAEMMTHHTALNDTVQGGVDETGEWRVSRIKDH